MQHPVDNEMGCMGFERDALLRRLTCADAVCEHYVAEQELGRWRLGQFFRVEHREGQHIGRLVLAAIVAVERVHFLVGGEADRDFDRRSKSCGTSMWCGTNCAADSPLCQNGPIPRWPWLFDLHFYPDHARSVRAKSSPL
jgi:hypothetical protein